MSLLAILMLTPCSAQAEDMFKIVVVVNGTPITQYDVDEQMKLIEKSFQSNPAMANLSRSELEQRLAEKRAIVIENMIEDQLLHEEIERLDLTVDPKQVDAYIENLRKENNLETLDDLKKEILAMGMEFDAFRKKITSDIQKQRLVQGMLGSKLVITDTEVEEAFLSNPEAEGGVRVHLRAIIVSTVEEMEKVIKSIDDGMSFSEAAKTYSVGPVPEEGGDMGMLAVINLSPAWQEALKGVEPGNMTEYFESEGSFVLLELVETANMTVDDIPGMRDKLFKKLRTEKMSKLFDQFMARLREMAVVEWK